MDTTLYVNLSTQVALERELEVVAHNIANMNTVGFRAERSMFDDAMKRAGASDPVAFVVDRATYTDMTPGALIPTGSDFDVAIQGEGWLTVETDAGVRYTRDGRMQRALTGELVNLQGQPVLDETGAPIFIPEEMGGFEVASDGTITGDDEQQLGRIAVVRFQDEQAMEREADGLYKTDLQAEPAFNAKLAQRMKEASNVVPIVEITRLIELSRAFESATRAASDVHDLKRGSITRLGDPQS
ncbi:MAG: flagellar basal-body rod protein FlgF [Pseudomonadota bacterium]